MDGELIHVMGGLPMLIPIPVSQTDDVVNRRPQIEQIMWGRRAADHHCGDDLVGHGNSKAVTPGTEPIFLRRVMMDSFPKSVIAYIRFEHARVSPMNPTLRFAFLQAAAHCTVLFRSATTRIPNFFYL